MKNVRKYFCLLVLLTCFVQVNGQEKKTDTEDFSKTSVKELDEAFIIAVKEGRSEEVKKLIEAGANVNQELTYTRQDYDWDYDVTRSALEYAAEHDRAEVIKVLIQAEPEIDDMNNALISAAEKGYVNVVKELLKASGVNINYVNGTDTALIAAIKNGRLGVVKELIQAGADVNYVDEYGNTPLILAVEHARPLSEFSKQAHERHLSRWESRAEIIQVLLKTAVNVNHANKYGSTALMQAIKNHDFNTVKSLLQIPGININHADKNGDTALMITVKNVQSSYIAGDMQQYNRCVNSQNILEVVFKAPGVDLYHSNKKGETAIKLINELAKKWN